jgi:hypothetical protein
MAMDPNLVDVFAHPMENPYTTSYYDTPAIFAESDLHKISSMPTTPPAAHPSEHFSSAPSIPSASSSAIGSPYSGTAQAFQDNWVNTGYGLGLPSAVMNDPMSNEYMGSAIDMDGFYQEKFPDNFVVGKWRWWTAGQPISNK